MTPKQEAALKLALEALEVATTPLAKDRQEVLRAQAVIREALAEQPAQQQEEPKRWAVFCSQCRKEWSVSYPHPGKSICAECDAKVEAQQQEPVAKVCHDLDGHIGWNPKLTQLPDEGTSLYTSPQPSKPWVGLTQQDINIAFDDTQEGGGFDDFARAIEAKLKERNT